MADKLGHSRHLQSPRSSWWREIVREEVLGLRLLAMLAVALVLVWIVFLGLRHGSIPFGLDVIELDWPAAVESLRVGGAPERLIYRATWVGGGRFLELFGLGADYRLHAALGLSAADAVSFNALLVQLEIAFFGVMAVQALHRLWGRGVQRMPSWMAILTGLGCAFAPYHGVEFAAGHPVLIEGVLPFAVPAALTLLACAGEVPTLVSVALAAVVLRATVGGAQKQTILNAVVFGGPILLVIVGRAWRAGRRRTAVPLALALTTVLGGVGLGLPWFSMMLDSATGPDAARSLQGIVLTWSRGANSLLDWLTLATAGTDLFTSRPLPHYLEAHVPAGLALTGLILVPWRRAWTLGVALLLSLLVLLAFTMHLEPVASVLLRAVPPLGSFRVPIRALYPLAMLMTWMALAAITSQCDLTPGADGDYADTKFARLVRPLAGATWLVGLWVAPGAIGEAFSLLSLWAWSVISRARPQWTRHAPIWFAPAVFAVASVASIARLLPMPCPESQLMSAIEKEAHAIATSTPHPGNALERTFADHELPTGPNGFSAAGVSGAFGYWFPTRRQLELYAGLQGREPDPSNHVLRPATLPPSAETQALALLYDIRSWRHHEDGNVLVLPQPTLGAAWFPSRWESVRNEAALARALLERARDPRAVRDTALVDGPPPGVIEAPCAAARPPIVHTRDGGQQVILEGTSPANCVLVLSMNWTSHHVARMKPRGQSVSERVDLWPVYGTLVGIQVPPGEWSLVVEPELPWPRWGRAGGVLGVLLLLVAAMGSVLLRSRIVAGREEYPGGISGD